jgi:hypothetical protein
MTDATEAVKAEGTQPGGSGIQKPLTRILLSERFFLPMGD